MDSQKVNSETESVGEPILGPAGPVLRREGLTRTERYLGKLAERSFLSLWSYPSLFKAPGAELCDLLVVFEDNIIIFSDKEIEFGNSGSLERDWARWMRKAVLKSANQIFGAERWLSRYPDKVFLDAKAKVKFPFTLPPADRMRVHRIVVAHDRSGRRREQIGGSGSLHVAPWISGDDHLRPFEDGGAPFAVGQVDPSRGFVHVLDDSSLHLVLGELDTITDFLAYLERKEVFIQSGKLASAAGEEELLAYYLKKTNNDGVHDFVIPPKYDALVLDEGHFRNRLERAEFRNKREADAVSYLWDEIASRFCSHALNNTLHYTSAPDLQRQERLIRFLAREPRVRRRMLARALLGKVEETPPDRMSSRMLMPSKPGDPYYIFVVVPPSFAKSYEEYRQGRAHVLRTYMAIAKRRFPDAEYVIGLATETRDSAQRSEDLAMLSAAEWTEEDERKAAEDQAALGLLTNLRIELGTEHEYPERRGESWTTKKIGRNDPCPCKSGQKYKKCCGRGFPRTVPARA